jgi:fucose permease
LQASLSLLELLSVTYAFRHETAARHAEDLRRAHGSRHGASSSPSSVFSALRHPVVWACAIYLLVYVGFESAITGWVIVFVRAKHHASALLGSLSLSGYWAGMAVGRTALGAAADRYGLRRSVVVYHLVALLFVLLFMIVPTAGLSVAVMVLLGVACGPLFPSAIVYLVSKLPAELHVVSVSTVCSMGQVGGALLPALIGVVADGVGMGAFQGIIFLQLIIVTGCWVVLTKERRSDYVAVRTTEE